MALFIVVGICSCGVWCIISVRNGDNVYCNVLFRFFKHKNTQDIHKPKNQKINIEEMRRQQWETLKKLRSRPRMVEEHLKLFPKYEGYTPKSLVFREKINVSGEPKETVQPRFSYVISNQMVRNGKKMRRGSAKKSNAGSKKNISGGKKTKSTNFDPVVPVNPLSQPQANAINDFSIPSKKKRRSPI